MCKYVRIFFLAVASCSVPVLRLIFGEEPIFEQRVTSECDIWDHQGTFT
jgi:hypothetical protein